MHSNDNRLYQWMQTPDETERTVRLQQARKKVSEEFQLPLCRLVFTFPPSCPYTHLVPLLQRMHHVKPAAVAFQSRSRSQSGRMDPRRRRFVMIAVVTLLLFILYTCAGHPASVSSAVQAGLDYFLHVPDLPAANATLGVSLNC